MCLEFGNLTTAGHKWPQATILRALTTGAKQLAEDHTVLLQFLNDNDVFSKDVKVVSPQVSVPPGPAPCNPPRRDFMVVGMSLTSGTKLGPYEILAPLGAGGVGEVYRAREVAIKVLPADLSAEPSVTRSSP